MAIEIGLLCPIVQYAFVLTISSQKFGHYYRGDYRSPVQKFSEINFSF